MEHDPVDLDGQAKTAKAEQIQFGIDRANEIVDVKELLETPAGRRFIWRLLTLAGVYRSSFASDIAVMAKNEGRRELGLVLLTDVTIADPDAYTKLIKEQKRG